MILINNFRKYNEKIFSWSDQVRLRDSVFKAKNRGVKVMVFNANNAAIRKLFKGFGRMKNVCRNSTLAADSKKRHMVTEIIIRSKIF